VFLALAAWVVAGLCVWASAARAARLAALETETRAAEGIERASRERLHAKLPEESRLGGILRASLAAESPKHGLALLNEEISDIGRDLTVGADVPRAAARASVLAGGCIGIIELIRAMPDATVGLPYAAGALVGGLFGAMVAAAFGRAAETSARRIRERSNELSRAVGRLLQDPETPTDSKENGDPESVI
jgi:hypothetical protein